MCVGCTLAMKAYLWLHVYSNILRVNKISAYSLYLLSPYAYAGHKLLHVNLLAELTSAYNYYCKANIFAAYHMTQKFYGNNFL